jgi:hypothetical protein
MSCRPSLPRPQTRRPRAAEPSRTWAVDRWRVKPGRSLPFGQGPCSVLCPQLGPNRLRIQPTISYFRRPSNNEADPQFQVCSAKKDVAFRSRICMSARRCKFVFGRDDLLVFSDNPNVACERDGQSQLEHWSESMEIPGFRLRTGAIITSEAFLAGGLGHL